MSAWVPVMAYDVAYIDRTALVVVRGGGHYTLYGDDKPAWRTFATVEDLDDARRLAAAMNATLTVAVAVLTGET